MSNASVGHQHINTAIFQHSPLVRTCNGVFADNIHLDANGAVAGICLRNLLGKGLSSMSVQVSAYHMCASLSEPTCYGRADCPSSAGYQRHTSTKLFFGWSKGKLVQLKGPVLCIESILH